MIFDLIMMHASGGDVWTPAELFLPGNVGAWYDGSDYSNMFMDVDANLLVTGPNQPVGLWRPSFGTDPLFNVRQATATARPLTVTNSGKLALQFDGVDDILSAVNTSYTYNEVTFAAGFTSGDTGGLARRIFDINITSQGEILILTGHPTAGTALRVQALSWNALSTNAIIPNAPQVGMGFAGAVSGTPVTARLEGINTENGTIFGSSSYIQVNVGATNTPVILSQLFFIDRVLTPSEFTLLETFIASKQ